MKLKIALQKQGRLADGSTELLRKCGIGFSNGLGKLRAEAADFPLEIFFLREAKKRLRLNASIKVILQF